MQSHDTQNLQLLKSKGNTLSVPATILRAGRVDLCEKKKIKMQVSMCMGGCTRLCMRESFNESSQRILPSSFSLWGNEVHTHCGTEGLTEILQVCLSDCVCQFNCLCSKPNISWNHMGEIQMKAGSRTLMVTRAW